MTPILRTPTSGPPCVDSFLALVDSPTVPGTSLRSVWYKRTSPALGGGWEAKAWESENQWEAIKYVKLELGIGDEFDGIWPTTDDPEPVPEELPEIPTDYVSGLKANDPLAGVLVLPGRDLIVEVLVAVGYKGADIPFERAEYADVCGFETVLDAFALGADDSLSVPPEQVAEVAHASAQSRLASACGYLFCFPRVTYGPWVPVMPVVWTTAGWIFELSTPTIGGAYMCDYYRLICRTQQRARVVTHWDCTTTTTFPTRQQCWRENCSCTNLNGGNCPMPPTCCPAPSLTAPPPGTPWEYP
ncbi:MAG: hypothetical protein ACK4WH_01365 [Phycisphaerales bacterium]